MNFTNCFEYILIGFIIQTSHHAEIPSDADAHAAEAQFQVVLCHYRRMVQVTAEARASSTAAATTTGLLGANKRLLLLLLTVMLLGGFQ